MKKVKRRTLSLIVLVAVLVIGLAVFMFRLVKDGSSWVSFPANRAVFTAGVLTSGRLTARNGGVLADITDGYRTYAESSEVRKACLHVVGDTSGNIGTGALTAFASKLVGYDLISGTYSLTGKGKTVALSIDSSLNTVAYEALNGRKGTVAVCNYETGEILCNVSNPTYDPANPPESVDSSEYEGVYINRFLSSQYTPGSIFKIVTLTAAI